MGLAAFEATTLQAAQLKNCQELSSSIDFLAMLERRKMISKWFALLQFAIFEATNLPAARYSRSYHRGLNSKLWKKKRRET